MDKFSELVAKGVAAFNYTPIANSTPEQCPICREYNNLYGAATDTHMSTLSDGRKVITGHIIADKNKFDRFMWSCQYMGVDFRSNGYSFSSWINSKGLEGHYDVLNNDAVYILEPRKTTGDEENKALADEAVPAMSAYTTSESIIPVNMRWLSRNSDIQDIKDCIKEGVYATVQALNESRNVHGNQYAVAYLSDGIHIVGNVNGHAIKFE